MMQSVSNSGQAYELQNCEYQAKTVTEVTSAAPQAQIEQKTTSMFQSLIEKIGQNKIPLIALTFAGAGLAAGGIFYFRGKEWAENKENNKERPAYLGSFQECSQVTSLTELEESLKNFAAKDEKETYWKCKEKNEETCIVDSKRNVTCIGKDGLTSEGVLGEQGAYTASVTFEEKTVEAAEGQEAAKDPANTDGQEAAKAQIERKLKFIGVATLEEFCKTHRIQDAETCIARWNIRLNPNKA